MNFSIENKLDTIEIRIPMGFNKGGSSDTSLWFASIHSIPHQFGFHQECPDVFSEIDCQPFSKIYPALRSLLFPAVSDRWEIYGRSPLHPDWEGPRGWRTPRNFARPALPPSKIFSSPQSPWRDTFQSLRLWFSFSKNIFYQVETAFGKLVEERFEYLIVHGLSFFRWQRALGLSGDLPRPTKLQLVLWVLPLNFPLNLSRFCQGPFDLNILSCS